MNTQPDMPKPPCPADATLYSALLPLLRAGALPSGEQEALRRHMRFCAPCREEAMAAADQAIEGSVRRQYGIPANVPPFLTLDDIQRRVFRASADAAPDARNAQDTQDTADTDEIDRLPVSLNHRGKRMTSDENDQSSSPTESLPQQPIPIKPPNRWRTIAAVVSAVAIIALFAVLLRGFAAGKGADGLAGTDASVTASSDATTAAQTPTAIAQGVWQVVDSMTYSTTAFTQTPYPVFSPKDPAIVYEISMSPISLRRSDDGGVTWKSLTLPAGSDQAIVVEIFASPLDAHTAFLTVTVNLAYGKGPDSCPSASRTAYATHGNILASGQMPCSTTYRTTDEGKSWHKISFPVNGTISTPYTDSAPYDGTPLQAQGTRLYAMLSCGPSCVSPGGRLVSSSNGGATWQEADGGGLGQGVCDFAAQPDSQAIFAAVSRGSCDVLNSPTLALDRSDDAGNSWVHVSFLPQGASQGMAVMMVGGKPRLIINLPAVNWQPHIIGVAQSADEFLVSGDGGKTWVRSPLKGTPSKAQPVISRLIVLADGSLVVAFPEGAPGTAKLYAWKSGEASWHPFAPAPQGQVATLLHTVAPTGGETIWAVITSSSTQSGNSQLFTFDVARYQL